MVKKLKAYYLLQGDTQYGNNSVCNFRPFKQRSTASGNHIEKVIDEVAKTYNVTAQDIRSARRSANVSVARQAAIYAAREIINYPFRPLARNLVAEIILRWFML